ncbi:unnamed protein product, partial [Ceratitis capitata]
PEKAIWRDEEKPPTSWPYRQHPLEKLREVPKQHLANALLDGNNTQINTERRDPIKRNPSSDSIGWFNGVEVIKCVIMEKG